MERPFNIFPSIGYKNSQFQVLSSIDGLKIKLLYKGEFKKEFFTSQENSVLISKLENPGIYIAKCVYQGEIFEQEITVQDIFRLGSSELKKAFVFDESNYSFFLMKDRLMLYDETKDILVTENHYSPTEILQVDKVNYLFKTEIGNEANGFVNLGIYNTESFSIVGNLLHDYQTIQISTEANKAWMFNNSSKNIHCFELISKSGGAFTEIRRFSNAANFEYNSVNEKILIDQEDKIIFTDTKSIDISVQVEKTAKNAVDKRGTNVLIYNNQISLVNKLENYRVSFNDFNNFNLDESKFLHVGSELKNTQQFTDLTEQVNEIKENIVKLIPKNKNHHLHSIPEEAVKHETIIQHDILPTIGGFFTIKKELVREFTGVFLKRRGEEWLAEPRTKHGSFFSVTYSNSSISKKQINATKSFEIIDYYEHCLVVRANNDKHILRGKDSKLFSDQCFFSFSTINGNSFLFVEKEELCSIFETSNLEYPILESVHILNYELVNSHGVVWFVGDDKFNKERNYLNALDLSSKFKIQLDEKRAQHSLFKCASDYEFTQGYILSSNNIVINPKNGKIKDSFLGNIESHSTNLNKIFSQRVNDVYLSTFNASSKKYEEKEVELNINKYHESYLSPSGQFLVLQDSSNKYLWYDIEKDKVIKFFSGNFLSFSKEGNLIIEENGTKAVKIFDPITFSEITPPNYHHYRFLSPDGKLYAQLSLKKRYFNTLTDHEMSFSERDKIKKDLDEPNIPFPLSGYRKEEYEKERNRVDNNRRSLFLNNTFKFNKIGIDDYSKILSRTLIKFREFVEIGIVGTDTKAEIMVPEDLNFYNYAAFSYDNKYFGYVGKPSSDGLVHLFKLDFDETSEKLSLVDSYSSRYPKSATWVCGFSKTGFFSTYDSTPNTYLLKVDEGLFESKTDEIELRENIYNSKSNIYYQYQKWSEIKGRNFLCFSPSGKYLALSEQGYSPLTLGGYGHQESNAVHIAITETGKIINSFNGHGGIIQHDKTKKVTFVAFSEDEQRIMTLSADGVVMIRNLSIQEIDNK